MHAECFSTRKSISFSCTRRKYSCYVLKILGDCDKKLATVCLRLIGALRQGIYSVAVIDRQGRALAEYLSGGISTSLLEGVSVMRR